MPCIPEPTGLFAMKSGTDIHTSNTLSPYDFGEPQTFPLALRGGRNNYKIGLVKQPHTAIFYFLSYKTRDVYQETSKTPT